MTEDNNQYLNKKKNSVVKTHVHSSSDTILAGGSLRSANEQNYSITSYVQ